LSCHKTDLLWIECKRFRKHTPVVTTCRDRSGTPTSAFCIWLSVGLAIVPKAASALVTCELKLLGLLLTICAALPNELPTRTAGWKRHPSDSYSGLP
jgi:hypothetical protein